MMANFVIASFSCACAREGSSGNLVLTTRLCRALARAQCRRRRQIPTGDLRSPPVHGLEAGTIIRFCSSSRGLLRLCSRSSERQSGINDAIVPGSCPSTACHRRRPIPTGDLRSPPVHGLEAGTIISFCSSSRALLRGEMELGSDYSIPRNASRSCALHPSFSAIFSRRASSGEMWA